MARMSESPKKNERELSDRDREAFLKSVTKGSSSPEDARHLRGVGGAMAALTLFVGADGFLLWKSGAFEDAASLGPGARGIAMLLMAELTFVAWVYRRLSARR